MSSIKNTNRSSRGRVRVHSMLTVVSSTPGQPGMVFPLSALDHAMAQHTVHIVFYYRSAPGSIDFDRIRPTLSEVLTSYPTVIGRLGRDGEGNWEIKCTDVGVRTLRAEVGTTLDEWLRTADGFEENDLTAWDEMPDDPCIWSPFRVQINEFEGGGVAVGLSCTHLLADPTCATLFFKAWTEGHRGEAIAHPPFVHPQALRCGRTQGSPLGSSSSDYYASKSRRKAPTQAMASATFSFSDLVIGQQLSRIRTKSPDATPFDLLTALFWSRIAKIKAPEVNRRQALSIVVDFRKRLRAPLPYGYFGNALHFSELAVDTEELEGGDVDDLVELVHSHVSGIEEDEFWSAVDWFESRKDENGKFAPAFRMYGPELTCVNMEDMVGPVEIAGTRSKPFMYTALFEADVKPVHVSYRVGDVEGDGLIIVMPSAEEGVARTVSVTLPEEQMIKLREDDVLLSLKPTLLLGGR